MNGTSNDRPYTMMTFAPMVDSECTRLLLAHYRVAYRESDHMFGLVTLLTLLRGGTGFVPLLYGGGVRLTAPRPIAEHFEPTVPEQYRLIPAAGDPLKAQVEADWLTYNTGIGGNTSKLAYYHLLPERDLMEPIFADPVPPFEKMLTRTFYPQIAWLFRTLLKLSQEHADEAFAKIRAIFDDTDKRIADGRPYLCGDRLTIGDVALASATAALLLPPGYGAKLPPLEQMPPALRSKMEELGQRPTGAFVRRLYTEGFAAGRPPA